MTKKHYFFGTLIAASLATNAFAATSIHGNFDQAVGNYSTVIDASNALIPSATGFVGLGTFTFAPETLSSRTAAELAANFQAYSTGSFGGADVGDAAGAFSIGSSAVIGGLTGSAIYAVYGNGSTIANSTQLGIIQDGLFPADPPPNTTPFDVNLVNLLATGTVRMGTSVPIAQSPVLDGLGLTAANNSIQLGRVVPEPSSLALLGLVGLLAIRRRR